MGWKQAGELTTSIVERDFEIEVDGRPVPGLYWIPAEGDPDRLVLLGHGGTNDKRVDYLQEVAQLLAAKGIGAMAIDGPGHGDRLIEVPESDPDRLHKMWTGGGGTEGMLADWRAALDFIEAEVGALPTGWWGLSMGTMMGLPVTATDSRIRVAVLGLMGTWGPNADDLARFAPEVECPLRFLVQWDDEVVPREACLDLFSLLGSKKRTLHANPGRHADVPSFEMSASVEYLDRYLK
ncbi:MAG: alpha/beta hydrolase [Actinomycetia bacterium]|nr:alpha/beta hydrolase [Actinomycetes bacterium]MCP4228270.1 alpha/beta hydrolase [Actinomycetes bacterium]MCP5031175.1 alpha/beta hydrolase [Actinomycetes bacterium]